MEWFVTLLLKFKTRKSHNALFSLAQAEHTRALQWCLFAYSLAYSEQNNLGIVIDVIRKMIKQTLFATFPPSSSPKLIGETLIALLNLNFYCGERLLMTISLHANNKTLGM